MKVKKSVPKNLLILAGLILFGMAMVAFNLLVTIWMKGFCSGGDC